MSTADVEYRCFVGGLAWATTDASLEQAFSPYGEVINSKIIMDRWTGQSRGFGFVTFREERAMRDAIEGMNGEELEGRIITVEAVRPRGSDGGGSRGPCYDGGYGGGGSAFGRWEQSILELIEDDRNEPRGPRRDGGSGGDGGAYARREGAYGGGRGGGYGRREGGYGRGRRPALMDVRLVYKTFTTLYFVFIFDNSENELTMLDLMQVFVETLDDCFSNVCDLDIVFNFNESVPQLHTILDEIILGGQVLETSSSEVVKAVEEISRLEMNANSIIPSIPGWQGR